MRANRKLVPFSLVLLLAFNLIACSGDPSDPETQIKQVISEIEAAAKERSNSGIMQHVSESYSDHNGLTKQDVRRLVTVQLLRNQKISVYSLIHSINIDSNIGEVEMSAAISGRDVDLSNEANRLRTDLFRFSLIFTAEDGDWKISSANWKQGW